jgi:DNA-binding transcriptional LysR family regulator
LGVQLFIRRTRGVALTDAGERVLEEARATLRQAERTKFVGRHAGRGELGSIALAYIYGPFVSGVVAASIAEFRKSHPDVAFQLSKTETFPQLKALAEATLDVGFMRMPGKYPAELDGFVVDQQELWLALPDRHPLASGKLIAPEQLVGETFLAHPVEFEIISAGNVAPLVPAGASGARKVARVSDITSALIMVASGGGVTLVPQSATQVGIAGVTYRKISGKPRYAEYVVAFRKAESSPAVRAFIAMLREKYKGGKPTHVDDARQLARRELPVSGDG